MSRNLFNPIPLVIDVMSHQQMPIQQMSFNEVVTELQGHWGSYKMQFFWQEDIHVLHLSILLDLPITDTKPRELYELIAILNERLIIGHFEIFPEENCPAFRYGIIATNSGALNFESLEEIIDIALDECESCFPAFKSLIEDKKTPAQAALIAVMDTVGEA